MDIVGICRGVQGDKFLTNGSAVCDLLLEVDQSYTKKDDNTKVEKLVIIPFNCYGSTAEKAMELEAGTKVKVAYSVTGREWQGKYYPQLRCIAVHGAEVKATEAKAE